MKAYVKKILHDGENLLKSDQISEFEVDEFERHISYCCHERLIHLLVILAFALMTMISLFAMMMFMQTATLFLCMIFTVMTAAYVWHYYFLENSVQKMYIIADQLHKNQIK